MYAVSFRIPFVVMGKRQYLNGSAYSKTLKSGSSIITVSGPHASEVEAEVIDNRRTSRNPVSFEYKIVTQ